VLNIYTLTGHKYNILVLNIYVDNTNMSNNLHFARNKYLNVRHRIRFKQIFTIKKKISHFVVYLCVMGT